jgi:predicted regulator of Ras-like GTPase activity (Roadblock/LC7/MglB family)
MSPASNALERITQVPGVRGSLVISAGDGLVVAERLMDGIDGRAIAALAGSLIQRLGRATLGAGMRIPTFVHLRGDQGSVLAAPGRNDLVLVALTGLDANLGLARVEMLDAVGHLSNPGLWSRSKQSLPSLRRG